MDPVPGIVELRRGLGLGQIVPHPQQRTGFCSATTAGFNNVCGL